jgi:HSP20 family molecular chaperone IbpA
MTRSILAQWSHIQRKLTGVSDHLLEPHGGGAWSPNADVYESADDVIIKVELAGVEKGSVRVRLEEQVVIIDGMRTDPCGGESTAGYRFRQMEIEYGPFHKAVPVPFPVDGANSTANMVNGFLKIRLPRATGNTQMKIAVITEP